MEQKGKLSPVINVAVQEAEEVIALIMWAEAD